MTTTATPNAFHWPDLSTAFITKGIGPDADDQPVPIYLVTAPLTEDVAGLSPAQSTWLKATGFKAGPGEVALLPGEDGALAGVVFGLGKATAEAEPCGPLAYLSGKLAKALPPGQYGFANLDEEQSRAASLAFGLGAYKFTRYQSSPGSDDDNSAPGKKLVQLIVAPEIATAVTPRVEAVWLGRDLINTPASDLGPEEIQAAAEAVARVNKASVSAIVGDNLLEQNFPMIHAVGRASARPPRLVDMRWQPDGAHDLPKITLIGKGIVFDTGGLDLKPAAGMVLMKKDMGGAATALALAHMIMQHKLPVQLRVLIPTAENSVSGNAFRPSDVLQSRAGMTVEVGNTDAEGRLVLADAITLADEEAPDRIITLATLTGAARVALGPDLPAFFTDDDAFAARIAKLGPHVADPVWRMPFWSNYDKRLKSAVADMNNISDGPFGGAITAALFLKRFVKNAQSFAHIDLYGWRPSATPLGPKGGEPGSARAVFEALREELEQS